MPGYKVHTGIGAIVGVGIVMFIAFLADHLGIMQDVFSLKNKVIIFSVSVLFALWPDVDTNSIAQDIFYSTMFVIDIILIFFKFYELAAYCGLVAILPVIGKHRGWTHSVVSLFLLPLPIIIVPLISDRWNFSYMNTVLYISAFSGYISHIVADRFFKN